MDAGSAASGFMMGLLFGGQTQAKPTLMHFVTVRVDRDVDIMNILNEILLDAFLDLPSETKLFFDFDKAQLKIHKQQKDKGKQPLFIFGLCGLAWTKKDYFLTLGLKGENGVPIEMNIALFRNLIVHLDAKKVKYELW